MNLATELYYFLSENRENAYKLDELVKEMKKKGIRDVNKRKIRKTLIITNSKRFKRIHNTMGKLKMGWYKEIPVVFYEGL